MLKDATLALDFIVADVECLHAPKLADLGRDGAYTIMGGQPEEYFKYTEG